MAQYVGGTTQHFWGAFDAGGTTYELSAEANNEGGVPNFAAFGPDAKFNGTAKSLSSKTWPQISAFVPPAGATKAFGSASGSSTVTVAGVGPGFGPGFGGFGPGPINGIGGGFGGGPAVNPTEYDANGLSLASVKKPIPGGFGTATATVTDPWQLDLPYLPGDGTSPITVDGITGTSSVGEGINMHTYVDLSGSSLSFDPNGSGSFDWHVSIDGINSADSNYLLDYSMADDASGLTSTLSVSPDVHIFLNDFYYSQTDPTVYYGNPEFTPSTEVTAAQLKSYLDSFQESGGWSLGNTPVLIGLEFAVPNSAVGTDPSDMSERVFDYHSDVTAEAYDAAPVPEPASAALMVVAGLGMVRWRRRR
jgi:hypothetical protein